MHNGSFLTTFLIILININFAFSSPSHKVLVDIHLTEDDPFCIKSNQSNSSIIAKFIADYIPKTDKLQFNETWTFYIFDGFVAVIAGTAIGIFLLKFLNILFEDEIRIHGIVKGIYATISQEVTIANEFSFYEAQRQLQYLNNNNNKSPTRIKPSRATAYVTRADR
uniref:Uncharacterized protein n=1 Tax=Panagrolaimus sp. ES5 TaxID=591445 RepID=A0AC34GAC2_9BILA